jgi:diadenosine tetraphosphatase ApaH/serine/threonine PP2A family protein phosphatase
VAAIKVDALIASHPVVYTVGDEALGLWLRMLGWLATYPKQQNFIPVYVAKHFGKRRQINALVSSGMWEEVEGGYRVYRKMDLAHCGHTRELWSLEANGESRRKIPDSLRAAVYDRDGRACVICFATEDLTLDHIYPWSLGGLDEYENFQTLCRSCNSQKGARV